MGKRLYLTSNKLDQRRLIKFNKNCEQIFFNVQQTEDLNFAKEFTYLNFNITLNYVVLSLKLSITDFNTTIANYTNTSTLVSNFYT